MESVHVHVWGRPSSTFKQRVTRSWPHAGRSKPSSGASFGDQSALGAQAACKLFQHQASGCSVAKETKASHAGFCLCVSCTGLHHWEVKGHRDYAWPWAVTHTLGGEMGFHCSLLLSPNPAVNQTLGFKETCREAAEPRRLIQSLQCTKIRNQLTSASSSREIPHAAPSFCVPLNTRGALLLQGL